MVMSSRTHHPIRMRHILSLLSFPIHPTIVGIQDATMVVQIGIRTFKLLQPLLEPVPSSLKITLKSGMRMDKMIATTEQSFQRNLVGITIGVDQELKVGLVQSIIWPVTIRVRSGILFGFGESISLVFDLRGLYTSLRNAPQYNF